MGRQGNIAMNGSYMVDSGTFVSKAIEQNISDSEKQQHSMGW